MMFSTSRTTTTRTSEALSYAKALSCNPVKSLRWDPDVNVPLVTSPQSSSSCVLSSVLV